MQDECSMPSYFVMLCSPAQLRYTALLESVCLYFVLYLVFELISPSSLLFLSDDFVAVFISIPSSYALFHTFSCSPFECFYKGCMQSDQQLIHSMFPNQTFESRPSQEISRLCWTVCLKKFEGIKNSLCLKHLAHVDSHSSCITCST